MSRHALGLSTIIIASLREWRESLHALPVHGQHEINALYRLQRVFYTMIYLITILISGIIFFSCRLPDSNRYVSLPILCIMARDDLSNLPRIYREWRGTIGIDNIT